jgi:hypothetical protein
MSRQWRRELAWRMITSTGAPCPDEEELNQGLSPPHAKAEVAHCHRLCGGKAEVHAAVGVDITHPFEERIQTPPEYVSEIVSAARDAGAASVILCREYQEISGASMRAAAATLAGSL